MFFLFPYLCLFVLPSQFPKLNFVKFVPTCENFLEKQYRAEPSNLDKIKFAVMNLVGLATYGGCCNGNEWRAGV